MTWIPFLAASVLALTMFVLHLWHDRRQRSSVRIYRSRFLQLLAQLDSIVAIVNSLGQHIKKIQDQRLLDYYEANLAMLETLLTAVQKYPPFGKDPTDLDPAFFLIKDMQSRILRTQKAFRKALLGKEVRLEDLHGHGKRASGCYFCSRPLVANRFSNVKVKIDGEVKQVTSCRICRNELETTKKVKVLYFMKNGQPVHWSQVDDYLPSEDYWNINRRHTIRKEKHLELVYSEPGIPLKDR